jgi:hypothetical protein
MSIRHGFVSLASICLQKTVFQLVLVSSGTSIRRKQPFKKPISSAC